MSDDISGGFTLASFKVGDETSPTHYLYIKQHESKDGVKPSERTLFVKNVPQFVNRKCIKILFQYCGEIEHIYIHSKPKPSLDVNASINSYSANEPKVGFKVVYVVFKDISGLIKALKCKDLPPVPPKTFDSCTGLKKWAKEYNSNFIDVGSVQKEIDMYIADYEKKIKEEKRKAKEIENAEDEEGWITITKHSKKPKISRNETVSNKIIHKQNKANEKKCLLNFYRYQLRESKMEHILELRKKFEKDKERIAQMKANRKFKPF